MLHRFNDVLHGLSPVCKKSFPFLRNACVIHYTKCRGSIQASARVALFLSSYLGVPLYDEERYFIDGGDAFSCDTFFTVNSPYAFCSFREGITRLMREKEDCTFFWVQNDYAISVAPKDIPDYFLWTTVPFNIEKRGNIEGDCYVNWNLTVWEDSPKKKTWEVPGVTYYGAYRAGRASYIEEFLFSVLYDVTVAVTSWKPKRKFEEAIYRYMGGEKKEGKWVIPSDATPPRFRFTDKFVDVPRSLQHFQSTVYLEDSWSHKKENYCSPANRFYEALVARVPIFFHDKSSTTMATAGYDVSPYSFSTQDELRELLSNWEDIRNEQLSWHRDYTQELCGMVDSALKQVKGLI